MKRMSKAIVLLLVAVQCLAVVACSKPALGDEYQRMGKRVISAVDDYLDGISTADEARAIVDPVYDEVKDVDSEGDVNITSFKTSVLIISGDLLMNTMGEPDDSDILEHRNKLAQMIGEKKRS